MQLAAIYSLCDLGSSNPEGIVEAIHAWRTTVLNNIPSAVTSGIAEITSLCKMELNLNLGKWTDLKEVPYFTKQ